MSPKLYARVVRFEAALKRKKQAPGLRWTDVAHEMGYHDQMHMVHDFALLAGATPSTVAPEFDIIVNDADAAAASRRYASLCTRCSPEPRRRT